MVQRIENRQVGGSACRFREHPHEWPGGIAQK
jgi:hypothetical protein